MDELFQCALYSKYIFRLPLLDITKWIRLPFLLELYFTTLSIYCFYSPRYRNNCRAILTTISGKTYMSNNRNCNRGGVFVYYRNYDCSSCITLTRNNTRYFDNENIAHIPIRMMKKNADIALSKLVLKI